MTSGCKARCLAYLRKHAGEWIAKGKICDLARTRGGYTGEMTGRRLRELASEGQIEVKEVDGHSHYRWTHDKKAEWMEKSRKAVAYFDSQPDTL